jgi:hypothetical protein
MDVNENERITNIPLRHKVNEELFHCCSTLRTAVVSIVGVIQSIACC